MQEVDIELEGLDWIVCHSGADIWHAQSDGEWNSDEQWENLIDFRCSCHTILLQISCFMLYACRPIVLFFGCAACSCMHAGHCCVAF